MNLYFAPMEGITGYVFRNTHKDFFGNLCTYFSPFINPTECEKKSIKELRDILPENNKNTPLTVQILTNSASHFLSTEKKVMDLGYDEININLGCPSNTVCKKGRGAGFLKDTEKLDNFLYEIFEKTNMKISIKTRLGFSNKEEIFELIEIYNKYPVKELIVHPRTREEFYLGIPHRNTFSKIISKSKIPLCYNGNIFSKEDFGYIKETFDNLNSVMIGRGAIMNPGIFNEILHDEKITKEKLKDFLECLSDNYMRVLQSEHYTLGKMKEIFLYVMWMFPEDTKAIKGIKKANSIKTLFESFYLTEDIKTPSGF